MWKQMPCYRDGSLTTKGSGSGVCFIRDDKILKLRTLGLTKKPELQAIRLVCGLINTNREREKISIIFKSQAAIKATGEMRWWVL